MDISDSLPALPAAARYLTIFFSLIFTRRVKIKEKRTKSTA
jgi:hypothetical protein